MTYTNPTPEEITHLASLCEEPSYTMPPNLTREGRRVFMCKCLEYKQVCDETLLSRGDSRTGDTCPKGLSDEEVLKWVRNRREDHTNDTRSI